MLFQPIYFFYAKQLVFLLIILFFLVLPVGYLTSLFEFLLIAISSLSDEYVICIGCKSPDTILSKENRLFFLRCEKVTFAYIVRLSYTRLTMGYARLYLRPS